MFACWVVPPGPAAEYGDRGLTSTEAMPAQFSCSDHGPANKMNGLPRMRGVKALTGAAASVLLLACMGPMPALADTIEAALVRAYQNNPQLNAQRAQVRVTDENVPQALSGYRPKVSVTASAGYQYSRSATAGGTGDQTRAQPAFTAPMRRIASAPPSSQTLYNGQQTANRTRAAESQVSGAREALRVLEQTVLLQAATIYMDYLRDSAIVEVQTKQRSRARTDPQADARPLQCRRGNAYRRRTVRGATRRRQDAVVDRGIHAEHDAIELPPHHRQRAGGAGAGVAGRSLPAGVRCRAPSILV